MRDDTKHSRFASFFVSLLCFFVFRALHAPIAKFLEFNFALNFLLVFFTHVIRPFAGRAVELYEAVL